MEAILHLHMHLDLPLADQKEDLVQTIYPFVMCNNYLKLVLCHFIIRTVAVHCSDTIFRHGIVYNLATAICSLTQLNALIE